MILLIILIIIILLICVNKFNLFDDTIEVYYDGIPYRVRGGNLDNAKNLNLVHKKLKELVDYCYEKSIPTKKQATRLRNRFYNTKFRETASHETSAAYVVNKGEELRVCMDNTDINDTMFVLLHELAHIMSETYGHNDEFKENMSFLVKEAVKLGIYQPTDYTKKPVNYCGTEITSTPCHNNQCLFGQKLE